jgi:hypothetical protein
MGILVKSPSITILKKRIDKSRIFKLGSAEFDKKEFKRYQKQNMEPFETFFLN